MAKQLLYLLMIVALGTPMSVACSQEFPSPEFFHGVWELTPGELTSSDKLALRLFGIGDGEGMVVLWNAKVDIPKRVLEAHLGEIAEKMDQSSILLVGLYNQKHISAKLLKLIEDSASSKNTIVFHKRGNAVILMVVGESADEDVRIQLEPSLLFMLNNRISPSE
jgi:hypothetical protein